MRSWGPALFRALVLLLFLLSAAGLVGLLLTWPAPPARVAGGPPAGLVVATAGAFDPALGAHPLSAVPPVWVAAPRIGLSAAVQPVAIGGDGVLQTPADGAVVGWFAGGAAPGDPGVALLDGHLDTVSGPAVFWHLSDLRPGDSIRVVRRDGGVATFRVDRTATYAYDERVPELFATTGDAQLALVTCAGRWDARRQTYLQRLVVHAALVDIAFGGR